MVLTVFAFTDEGVLSVDSRDSLGQYRSLAAQNPNKGRCGLNYTATDTKRREGFWVFVAVSKPFLKTKKMPL